MNGFMIFKICKFVLLRVLRMTQGTLTGLVIQAALPAVNSPCMYSTFVAVLSG